MKRKFIAVIISLVCFQLLGFSQVDIQKSQDIRRVDGKEYYIHIIQKGHTLYSLSKLYEIPIDEIIFENPEAKDRLLINQILKIPLVSRDEAVVETLRQKRGEFFYHVAKKDETLSSIAKIYSIHRSDVIRNNPGLANPLKPGQYIKIPVVEKKSTSSNNKNKSTPTYIKQKTVVKPTPKNTPSNIHIVKAGETLYRIALNYEVSIEDLKENNPGLNTSLTIGQEISIPVKKKEEEFLFHKVSRKGRLSKIAQQYNVDIEVLYKLNPGIKEKLRSGSIVKVPLNWKPEAEEIIAVVPEPELTKEEAIVDFKEYTEVLLNQDSLNCENYERLAYDTVRVALMIPLYLDEVDSLKYDEETIVDQLLDEQPFRFLQFYYGTRMAIDSLNALGLNVKLSVFDVDNSIGKTIKVLQDSSLQEHDLIIGPFFSRSFKLASHFAKIFEIPIVNPLTSRSQVIGDNPFVYKWEPTKYAQTDQIRNLISTYFRGSKVFMAKHRQQLEEHDFPLYHQKIYDLLDSGYYVQNEAIFDLIIEKSVADTSSLYEYVIDTLNMDSMLLYTTDFDSLYIDDRILDSISIEGLTLNTDSIEFNLYDSTYIPNKLVHFYYHQDSMYKFEEEASIYRNNVVMIFSDDNVFALDLMTQLNIRRDSFPTTVIGIPSWIDFDNMDYEILSNLNVHTLSASFVDYKDYTTNEFVHAFREKYLTEPQNYAFRGFDISWYIVNAILSYGRDFNSCLPYYLQPNIQTRIEFKKDGDKNGYENQYWKVLMYNRMHLRERIVEAPKPPEAQIE